MMGSNCGNSNLLVLNSNCSGGNNRSMTTLAIYERPLLEPLINATVELTWDWKMSTAERHDRMKEGMYEGGELGLSPVIRSCATDEKWIGLPILLKRGFVEEYVYCREDVPIRSLRDLKGLRVGVSALNSSVMVWLRGVLSDFYGVEPKQIEWYSLNIEAGFSENVLPLKVPLEFHMKRNDLKASERLDGTSRELKKEDHYLIHLLDTGALDAVVLTVNLLGNGIRTVIRPEQLYEEADGNARRVYPAYHVLALRRDVAKKNPNLPNDLVMAWRKCFPFVAQGLNEQTRNEWERDCNACGGLAPFTAELRKEDLNMLDTYLRYHREQRLVSKTLRIEDFLWLNGRSEIGR
jgi:hypothetical protein